MAFLERWIAGGKLRSGYFSQKPTYHSLAVGAANPRVARCLSKLTLLKKIAVGSRLERSPSKAQGQSPV